MTRAQELAKQLPTYQHPGLGRAMVDEACAELLRLDAIEAAAKTLREASGVVLAAQIRTHGDGETLTLPLPREYANEMKAAMDAQAALYRLLDADVLFNTEVDRAIGSGRTQS